MIGIAVPTVLADLVDEANCRIFSDPARGGLRIGDDETSLVVGRSDDLYTIRRISRGSLQPVTRKTTEPKAVWLHLAFVFGPEWRSRARLPHLFTPPSRQVRPGFELTKYGPSRYTLTWQDEGHLCRAEEMNERDALLIAHAWPFSLEDVIASYKDPDGLPAFPQDPTRTWSR